MHRGTLYPYLLDRWVPETAFWPGFVPQCIVLPHTALPVEWLTISLFREVSYDAQPSGDRRSVKWPFPMDDPNDVTFSMEVVAYNALAEPDRQAAYRLRVWLTAQPIDFDLRAFALLDRQFTTTTLFPDYWTEAVDFTTGFPIEVPGAKPRFATWAETP